MAAEEQAKTETPKPAPAKRRWPRRLLKIGIVLLVIVLLLPLAVALGPVRSMIADKIGEKIGREVTIDSSFAYWFKGIDLEGITISSPPGYEAPLARIEKVHVDVGVPGLLFGNVNADVEVLRPKVTLRQRPDGTSNLDGIAEALAGDEKERSSDGGGANLSLKVTDGSIEAVRGGETTRIEAITLAAALKDDGSMLLDLGSSAKGAKAGGGDAAITMSATLDGQGRGPFAAKTDEIDLARIAPLLAGVGAVQEIRGTLFIDGGGRITGPTGIDGKTTVKGNQLSGRLASGAAFAIRELTAELVGAKGAEESSFDLDADLKEVSYAMPGKTGTRHFSERLVTVDAKGAYQEAKKRLVVREAKIAAGPSLTAIAEKPWMIAMGPEPTAQGKARIDADFARLGSLRSFAPELERITSGRLAAVVNAKQGAGMDVIVAGRIRNLVLRSPLAGSTSHREPNVTVQARYISEAAGSRFELYTLSSVLVQSTGTSIQTPLVVHMKPGSMVVNGPIGLRADLAALSRVAPGALGLEAGESAQGVLTVTGNATGNAAKSTMEARVVGQGVRLPPRLDPGGTPGTVDALVRADMSEAETRVALRRLSGFGIEQGTGNVRLIRAGETSELGDSKLNIVADLARVRPWIATRIGLAPEARLSGRLTVDVTTREKEGGLALAGTSFVENLLWQPSARDLPVREGRATINHDVWLAPEGERSRLTRLALALTGLTIDASGSSFADAGDAFDVDLQGTMQGDAARLAPTVAAVMGPDYQDMRGQGPISGRFEASGDAAEGLGGLLIDVALTAGSWSSGGLSIQQTRVGARREALSDQLAVVLDAVFNGGPTKVQLGLGSDDVRDLVPWTLKLNAQGVDTSTLLVDRGPSSFLTFALPSLLPSDSRVPVLSGLLDADVELSSSGFEDPYLLKDLAGDGRIFLKSGEIKNALLFRGAKGGKLGQAVQLLSVAVREVGDVIQSVSRALQFDTLESQFQIANQQVIVQRTDLKGRYVGVAAKGTISFEQQVDMTTDLTFEGTAGKKVEKYLPGRTLPLKVTGRAPNTRVVPNVDVKKLVGGGVLDGAKDKVKDKVKDLIKGKKPKDVIKDLKDLIK